MVGRREAQGRRGERVCGGKGDGGKRRENQNKENLVTQRVYRSSLILAGRLFPRGRSGSV